MRHVEGGRCCLMGIIFLSLQGHLQAALIGLTSGEYQRNRLYIESSSCYEERLDPSLKPFNAKTTSWAEFDKTATGRNDSFHSLIIFTSHHT